MRLFTIRNNKEKSNTSVKNLLKSSIQEQLYVASNALRSENDLACHLNK